MKKTFELTHPKIKPARMLDGIKHDIKKYVKRERNKKLPLDTDYWDFDCKFGDSEDVAEKIHLSAINKAIDEAVASGALRFYVEIIAKAEVRKYSGTEPEFDLHDE